MINRRNYFDQTNKKKKKKKKERNISIKRSKNFNHSK